MKFRVLLDVDYTEEVSADEVHEAVESALLDEGLDGTVLTITTLEDDEDFDADYDSYEEEEGDDEDEDFEDEDDEE